ncbi:MAG: ribonucleotide-diphosphate reductase subunit beta [Blastochloris viridis]|uniref:Ribonucleoside-diphosphate reductase subunit beta n=1 Tax=Blastochloris viridis TaxID=1079 RepID=A0A6N4RAB3_BLAVI|nr:MAG: ribonucleotide-diphosphate reductase subunit beta [Blastochloris viridis]
MANLKVERVGYKPFDYPWAYESWLMQQRIHWLPEEVPMADDVKQWNTELNAAEKNLLTQIFRFFTQSDVEVNGAYLKYFTQVFKSTEVLMMMTSFANMETVHIAAYSHLLDTIGMPETEYSAFMEYSEMKDKYDFLHSVNVDDDHSIAVAMAIFAAFTEGLSLFASFAMLMNFPRFNKMKGMGQIVTWSVRDETLHVQSMIKLFNTFVSENPSIWTDRLKTEITDACKKIVEMEDKFIDLAFEMGPIEGMTPQDVQNYIRFIADRRLRSLNIDPVYNIEKNPLPWMDLMLNADEHANFFEQRATEYAKASTRGNWDEAFDAMLESSTIESAVSPVNNQTWEESKLANVFKPLQEFGKSDA